MFQTGPIQGVVFRTLACHEDARGWLIELYRQDELGEDIRPVMCYLSQTDPGATRGPHQHMRQTDCFAFVGPGDVKLYLWDAREGSPTQGNRQVAVVGRSNPQAVIVPPGVVHAYKNIGPGPAWVFNSPNRLYAGKNHEGPVDEIRYEGQPDCPYLMD